MTGPPPLPLHLHCTLRAHSGPIHVARLNSFGRYLLTGGADRQIHLFNASSASSSSPPIKTYNSHNGTVQALDISPDNARFLSGGEDRNVYLYDVAKGLVLRRFSAHHGAINALAFAGEQGAALVAAAGFDTTLRFYDLRAQGAWRPIMECKEAKDAILCMAIRDANLWTGSVDGVVRTYDLRKGELREDTIDRALFLPLPSLPLFKKGDEKDADERVFYQAPSLH
ncbi:hypothetical protein L7F22_053465 [Adiantum nelumboides]|nr:hypothetical protein [Adiantum nelumboides]